MYFFNKCVRIRLEMSEIYRVISETTLQEKDTAKHDKLMIIG
jgi:hypothetical protein